MGIFDFFKKKQSQDLGKPQVDFTEPPIDSIDRSSWNGSQFEFLIVGDIDISTAEFDEVMTPNTFNWEKLIKEDWLYYQIDGDEYSYSFEMPGIQMTFNKEVSFPKAKRIADEVVENIIRTGQEAELVIVDKDTPAGF